MSAPSAETTRPTVPLDDDTSGPRTGDAGDLAGLGLQRRLGRYTLLDLIGHGGMGVVLSAYDEELDRKVAIKFVRQQKRAPPCSPRPKRSLARCRCGPRSRGEADAPSGRDGARERDGRGRLP